MVLETEEKLKNIRLEIDLDLSKKERVESEKERMMAEVEL